MFIVQLSTVNYQLAQFHFVDIQLLLAVVTGQHTILNVEVGLHRLIVGNTLGVITLHNALDFRWCYHATNLNHLVVADDAQYHVRGNYREARHLVVGKSLIAHLDDAFRAHLL